jgi:hypothetical protein
VEFFEPVNVRQPKFGRERNPVPWEDGFGQTVFSDVNLARGPDGMLMMRNLIVFPRVMTFAVVALLRNPLVEGPGTLSDNCVTFSSYEEQSVATGIVLLGLRFSDGTEFRNLNKPGSAGHLENLGGGGSDSIAEYEFFAPLPPPGDVEVWTAWPAAQIQETRTVLDGGQIAQTASALHPPWH